MPMERMPLRPPDCTESTIALHMMLENRSPASCRDYVLRGHATNIRKLARRPLFDPIVFAGSLISRRASVCVAFLAQLPTVRRRFPSLWPCASFDAPQADCDTDLRCSSVFTFQRPLSGMCHISSDLFLNRCSTTAFNARGFVFALILLIQLNAAVAEEGVRAENYCCYRDWRKENRPRWGEQRFLRRSGKSVSLRS